MEDKNNKVTPNKAANWIECESKSRPGFKYRFNTATGEREWLTPVASVANVARPQRKLQPANDRLKRLQKELQKPKPLIKKEKTDDDNKPQRPTAVKKKTIPTVALPMLTPKERLKKLQTTAIKEELNNAKKESLNSKPKVATNSKSRSATPQDKQVSNKGLARKRRATVIDEAVIKETGGKKPLVKLKKNENPVLTPKDRLKVKDYVIPKKPNVDNKKNCTITTNESNNKESLNNQNKPKLVEVASSAPDCKRVSDIENINFRPSIQTISSANLGLAHVLPSIDDTKVVTVKTVEYDKPKALEEIKDTNCTAGIENKIFEKPRSDKCVPNNDEVSLLSRFESTELKYLAEANDIPTPSSKRTKLCVNQRLERFRNFLQTENSVQIQSTSNSTTSSVEEYESMDWEPIEEPSTTWLADYASKNNNTVEDMDIDENLLLVAAEIQELKEIEEKWQKASVYVVFDTNIFIHNLSFFEELRIKNVEDERNIVLYLPYTVLQELDGLKKSEKCGRQARNAIKYLNKMFLGKNKNIQAQTASEERNHIIDVNSADDSILNCCLQVKAKVSNVILITCDINLQNKAMCNDIAVSTISEIVKNQYQLPTV